MSNTINYTNSLFKFDWINENTQENRTSYFLAGDLGGTKCLLAVFKKEGERIERLSEKKYASSEFTGIDEIITDFMKGLEIKPVLLVLGIAGPIMNQSVQMTNLSWEFSAASLKEQFNFEEVYLLNDLEAAAYGLAALKEEDIVPLQQVKGQKVPGNMAILAPGTGLGIAGLFWDGKVYHPFPTEGGHALYSPSQTFDQHFWSLLQEKYGLVSWEHVLQGKGIFEMYRFLIQISKDKPDAAFHEKIMASDYPTPLISEAGVQKTDKMASVTMQYYCMNLFACLTNVALQFKATGGVLLGGGIPPKILPMLAQMALSQPFLRHPNMDQLLQKIPVWVIRNEETALNGAAVYAAWVKK